MTLNGILYFDYGKYSTEYQRLMALAVLQQQSSSQHEQLVEVFYHV